jgi:hypothetical protein
LSNAVDFATWQRGRNNRAGDLFKWLKDPNGTAKNQLVKKMRIGALFKISAARTSWHLPTPELMPILVAKKNNSFIHNFLTLSLTYCWSEHPVSRRLKLHARAA